MSAGNESKDSGNVCASWSICSAKKKSTHVSAPHRNGPTAPCLFSHASNGPKIPGNRVFYSSFAPKKKRGGKKEGEREKFFLAPLIKRDSAVSGRAKKKKKVARMKAKIQTCIYEVRSKQNTQPSHTRRAREKETRGREAEEPWDDYKLRREVKHKSSGQNMVSVHASLRTRKSLMSSSDRAP